MISAGRFQCSLCGGDALPTDPFCLSCGERTLVASKTGSNSSLPAGRSRAGAVLMLVVFLFALPFSRALFVRSPRQARE